MATALATRGAAVFRVREAAQLLARTEPIIAGVVDGCPDGWLPDLLAHDLMRTALDTAVGRVLVLEGYPGTTAAARSLQLCLKARSRRLSVIELTARPGILAARLARRRVCPEGHRAPGRSHAPGPSVSGPGRCGACDAPLTVRDIDRGPLADGRLARYAANQAGIRTALEGDSTVAWHTLTADPDSPDPAFCVVNLLACAEGMLR
ncbi:hypothetical protein [Streptomyces sp. TLI_146]|uniref:hypothetical protein n=1 Tax=Streptomyces sp. TLI_146 TaxID=1938858 RepID=UPI00117D5EC7|nr:hypothetical protein [Streptomyces sp. TLI_146]